MLCWTTSEHTTWGDDHYPLDCLYTCTNTFSNFVLLDKWYQLSWNPTEGHHYGKLKCLCVCWTFILKHSQLWIQNCFIFVEHMFFFFCWSHHKVFILELHFEVVKVWVYFVSLSPNCAFIDYFLLGKNYPVFPRGLSIFCLCANNWQYIMEMPILGSLLCVLNEYKFCNCNRVQHHMVSHICSHKSCTHIHLSSSQTITRLFFYTIPISKYIKI